MSPAKPLRPRQGIQSIERAFRILKVLVNASGPLRLAEIANAAGMSRTLAHAYLVSLQRVGAAAKDTSGSYQLGEGAIEMGLSAISKMDLFTIARDFMQRLLDQTGASIWLSVWSHDGPVVVAKVDGRDLAPFEIRIGTRVEVSVTATGCTFLAHLDPAVWKRLLKQERQALGSLAPDDRKLNIILQNIRQDNVASRHSLISHGHALPQFASVAAPVFDYSGTIKAVLTVIGPTRDFDISPAGLNARAVREVAASLSSRLGYSRTQTA